MASPTKPLVLISTTPIYGHVMPLRAIGKQLVSRGYEVTFLTSSAYKSAMEEIGIAFVPIEGYGDFTEGDIDSRWPIRNTLPSGPVQLVYDLENVFVKAIPSQHDALQKALQLLSDRRPGRPIVLITEAAFFGVLPMLTGSPGLRPAGTLGLGIIPMGLSSIDTAPFGVGLPPDSSPEGRERNKAMFKGMVNEVMASPQQTFEKILEELNCKNPGRFLLDLVYLLPDIFLQMCIPSVEYPRSDAPDSIRFGGGMAKGQRDAFSNPPSWWSEVVENKTKKIIGVSQGSVAMNFTDLVIPTMTGLANEEDILVVVALGKKGAALPEGTLIPANARVADFIPFDELMPYCSAFISNGGYGTFQHCVSHALPIIIGGETEDKPEVAGRAEWCGIGINLHTATPAPELILSSVSEIISNPKYKKRALELETEMGTFDPIGVIIQNIEDLAAGNHLKG